MNIKVKFLLCVFIALLGLVLVDISAQNVSPQAIKALYTVQMQRFVKLDTSARSIKNICYYEKYPVLPNESVGQQIEKYLSKRQSLGLTVKKFKAVGNFSGCDLLYIPKDDESDLKEILVALGDSPILTVSSIPHFISRGGMIGFIIDENDRVRMQGNLKVAREKGIKLEARLLELMVAVIQ